jgi:hypothetical protein
LCAKRDKFLFKRKNMNHLWYSKQDSPNGINKTGILFRNNITSYHYAVLPTEGEKLWIFED